MTYTFKLARRLAVSRTLGMFPALLLFAACSGGDATAPEGSPAHPLSSGSQDDPRFRRTAPLTVSISPINVTVETNQLIRFEATGITVAGDTVDATVDWTASGGTILPDGRFSAAATGTFMVLARSPDRQVERIDTAVVKVVRRQPDLASLSIDPGSTSLTPGLKQTFLATGHMKDGRPVPVGVIWNATGGSIDAGGTYVAGDTAGTYQVIATNTKLTLSDTAVVTIGAPAPPPPPPAPVPPAESLPAEPPPAPVLQSVALLPASATLAPTTTRQFAAFGRLTTGDSVAVGDVVFTATGGTVTAAGLFTAGSTAGTYRVVAKSGLLADTSVVTVTQPLGSGPAGTGIPFGPYNAWEGTTLKSNTGEFTAAIGAVTASTILAQITEARSKGKKLILAMTGGGHNNYLTDGVFDYSKWKARMDAFNTAAIRDAVAKAVADGTIVGNNVMDEPNVSGAGDGNTWGPAGTMTKERVDGLCGYVKTIFPTLPVGVAHNHDAFEPTKSYKVCEFLLSQYHTRKGDIRTWRDAGLALAKRDGHAIAFSLNTLSGGFQAPRDGAWYCDPVTTGGRGTYDPNCRMTAQQIRDFARVLAPYGCALMMWRYDAGMMADPAYQQAFKDVAAMINTLPAKSCRRG